MLVGDEEEDSSERAAAGTATEQPEVDMDVDGAAVGPMDAAVGSASDLADEVSTLGTEREHVENGRTRKKEGTENRRRWCSDV